MGFMQSSCWHTHPLHAQKHKGCKPAAPLMQQKACGAASTSSGGGRGDSPCNPDSGGAEGGSGVEHTVDPGVPSSGGAAAAGQMGGEPCDAPGVPRIGKSGGSVDGGSGDGGSGGGCSGALVGGSSGHPSSSGNPGSDQGAAAGGSGLDTGTGNGRATETTGGANGGCQGRSDVCPPGGSGGASSGVGDGGGSLANTGAALATKGREIFLAFDITQRQQHMQRVAFAQALQLLLATELSISGGAAGNGGGAADGGATAVLKELLRTITSLHAERPYRSAVVAVRLARDRRLGGRPEPRLLPPSTPELLDLRAEANELLALQSVQVLPGSQWLQLPRLAVHKLSTANIML